MTMISTIPAVQVDAALQPWAVSHDDDTQCARLLQDFGGGRTLEYSLDGVGGCNETGHEADVALPTRRSTSTWKTYLDHVKFDAVFHGRPSDLSFEIGVALEGLTLVEEGAVVQVIDTEGDKVASILPPTFRDGSGVEHSVAWSVGAGVLSVDLPALEEDALWVGAVLDPTTVDTSTEATATAWGNQVKIDRCQNGVLWTIFRNSSTGDIEFWYSTDNGQTFTAAATPVSNNLEGAIFIDLDDYCHFVYKLSGDSKTYYRRGTPNAGRTAWTWSAALLIKATGEYYYSDLVAHRQGTGWKVHIVTSYFPGTANNGYNYDRVNITDVGVMTVEGGIGGTNYGVAAHVYPSIDFHHTGDGKTVAGGTPHLYLGWTAGANGAGKGVRFRKATYNAGAWTWQTEREIDTGRHVPGASYWLRCMFDGTRVVIVAWTSDGSAQDLVIYERDAADTASTTRVQIDNATGAQVMSYGSASYNKDGDIYIFGMHSNEGAGTQDFVYRKWTRATLTLGAEVIIDATTATPYASAKRGYRSGTSADTIDVLYMDGSASPWNIVHYSILLNQPPLSPTLVSPVGNAFIDRAVINTFDHDFLDPDTGDSQSALEYRYRVVGAPTWTTVSQTTTNTFKDFVALTFAVGDYEWQARCADAQGVYGPFSASSFFRVREAPPAPTITDPTNGETIPTNSHVVVWSAPNQESFQIRRVADNAGAANPAVVYLDTGELVSSEARSREVDFETNNRWEHVQVRVRKDTLWSAWASHRVFVSFTAPTAPVVLPGGDDAAFHILVTVDNGDWPVDVSTPVRTGTGTGTMANPVATPDVTDSHDWEAVCVTAAANGGTFDVKKDGVVIGQAPVGVLFTHEGLSFTIQDGATDFIVGDKFTWATVAVKVTRNDLYRRPVGDTGEGVRISTTLGTNGSHVDWAVGSGKAYEYQAKAHGDNGVTALSPWTA